MTNNHRTNELLADLGCQHERIEAIRAFLEDVNEQFSDYGIGRNSSELQSANSKLISLLSFLERELDDMNKTMDELRELNRPYPSVDVKAVREVAKTLDAVVQQEAPHIMIVNDGKKEWQQEMSREEMLVHHIEVAAQDLLEIVGEEDEK